MKENNKLLDAALNYAKQGFPVFPCSGKLPLTPNGVKDATTDSEAIKSYWAKHPSANIGLATGKTSNLVVLDVDMGPGKEGLQSLQDLYTELKCEPWGHAHSITGSGGFHFFMKYQEGIRNKVDFRPGLDIRSEGGYVIVPPSINIESNNPYKWIREINLNHLYEMPSKLFEEIKTEKQSQLYSSSIFLEESSIQKGGRHKHLMSLAGSLRKRDLSLEAIHSALSSENAMKCNPPISENDIKRMVKSVSTYPPGTPVSEMLSEYNNGNTKELESSTANSLTDQESTTGKLVHVSELGSLTMEYLKDKAKVKGLPRGLDGLDLLLGGGARLGEVTCWHAEAKTGKNTLWHYLMYIWLELGIKIAYASRELSPEEEVLPNLLSVSIGKNVWLDALTEERKNEYNGIIRDWPLYFSHGYGYFPVHQISEWVDRAISAGINYFWFDHLHYMLEDPEDHKAASRLIKDLKSLAKTKKIHIDIIIQPNKLVDGQRLSLNSIKGGAAMGQAIDNLLILERVKGQQNISKLTLEVARSKLCNPGHIHLQFDKESTRFMETKPEVQSDISEDNDATGPHSPTPSRWPGMGAWGGGARQDGGNLEFKKMI